MSGLLRLTTVWEGAPGLPGYTNFYGHHNGVSAQDVADQFADDIHDFWNTVNGYLPAAVSVTISPTWQSIAEATGDVQAEGQVASPPALVQGTWGGVWAGNCGVAVDWHTSTFISGRRLKGRTYLVPFANVFEYNGTLVSTAITAIGDAATTLYTGSTNMVVWHRPVGGAGGSSAQITSVSISDRVAILRSRSV